MLRTQIQITEEQARALRQVAADDGVSMSEVVRRGIDDLLRARHQPSVEELRRRARAVAGRFRSDRPDVATEHDRELAEAYAD